MGAALTAAAAACPFVFFVFADELSLAFLLIFTTAIEGDRSVRTSVAGLRWLALACVGLCWLAFACVCLPNIGRIYSSAGSWETSKVELEGRSKE